MSTSILQALSYGCGRADEDAGVASKGSDYAGKILRFLSRCPFAERLQYTCNARGLRRVPPPEQALINLGLITDSPTPLFKTMVGVTALTPWTPVARSAPQRSRAPRGAYGGASAPEGGLAGARWTVSVLGGVRHPPGQSRGQPCPAAVLGPGPGPGRAPGAAGRMRQR